MKVDGRKLNHSQLEAIRLRRQGGAGWRAADGGCTRDGALYESRACLVGRVPRGWIGCSSCAEGQRSPEASDRIADEMDLGRLLRRTRRSCSFHLRCGRGDDSHADLARPASNGAWSQLEAAGSNGIDMPESLSRAFEEVATLVKAWVKREFPKLQAFAEKERAVNFFSDESGVRSDFHAGTTWGIRGRTPSFVTPANDHLNMLSAISAKAS